MGGRFGKYGDIKRKTKIRQSGIFGKKDSKLIPKTQKSRRPKAKAKIQKKSA